MKWIVKCLRNYANFRGRARRRELWLFLLFETVVILALGIAGNRFWPAHVVMVVKVFMLLLFLPLLGVEVRRMHDIGRSGWWVVAYWVLAAVLHAGDVLLQDRVSDIELIGVLVQGGCLLVLLGCFVQAGDAGGNRYGPDPKAEGTDPCPRLQDNQPGTPEPNKYGPDPKAE